MKILIFDELREDFDAQIQLLQRGANWGIFDFEQIKRSLKLGYPSSPYYGVYGIEENEVICKVEVIEFEFETINGIETVAGIAGVLTRQDKSREGLARKLLENVHQREKEAGIKISLLWTGCNNKAHNLYESLGYVDVYGPTFAVRKIPNNHNYDGKLKIRQASKEDAVVMENLHSKLANGRLGFTKRPKGLTRMFFEVGIEEPKSFQIILSENSEPIGYAQFQESSWISSHEVVIDQQYTNETISLLSKKAKGKWLSFGDTFVLDNKESLARQGYKISSYSYNTLMALPLDTNLTNSDIASLLGTKNPKFICQSMDHF